jgi:hypothetical protein
MKSSYLRAGLALLCAVILSACGGNNGSLALSGTISYSGPAKAGLVLENTNTGEKVAIDTGVTSFVFTKLLAEDEQFNVISHDPAGEVCTGTTANSGKASVYTVYYLVFTCKVNPYTLGGTVKNLTGSGLVLANGSDTVGVPPSATAGSNISFIFPTKVADGASYGVSVLTQPTGQTCSVDSALNPALMPAGDQLGLIVNCVNN